MADKPQISCAAAAQIKAAEESAQRVIKAHPELHHYTREVGLKGILESNALRATYFADLNDAQEIHALRTPLVEAFADRLMPIVKEARFRGAPERHVVWRHDAPQYLARRWGNYLYEVIFSDHERKAYCCTTSFCSHVGDQPYEREHGLLSQWRAYGGHGEYCLVFDAAALWELFKQERGAFLYPYTDVREAHYPRDGAKELESFIALLDKSEAVYRTALVGRGDPDVDLTLWPFLASATAFKHQGFYEEREVRLVAMAGTELAAEAERKVGRTPAPVKEILKRPHAGGERRHILLFGKDFAKLPIKRVIVGPSRSQDSNADIARKIVGADVSVTKSETPYIG